MARTIQSQRLRELLRGAAWLYGSQVATVLLQFGYAALASRMVSPANFGAYNVALISTGLFTLLANAGLAQTVARLQADSLKRVRAVMSIAYGLALISGGLTYFSAEICASAWGNASASPVIQLLAVAAATSPLQSALSGLARRQGAFRGLALITFLANVVAFALGAFAVIVWRSAESLAVSNVVAAVVLTMALAVRYGRYLRPGSVRGNLDLVRFSSGVTISSVVQYVNGNAARFGAAQVVGSAVMGQWNRAEVLSSIPMQQIQVSLVQVLYPEFRHHMEPSLATRRVWTILLQAVMYFSAPVSAVGAAIVPILVPLLLGNGWEIASRFIAGLFVGAGLQMSVVVLASAVEATGRFRAVAAANLANLVGQALLTFTVLISESVWPAVFAPAVSAAILFLVYGVWAAKEGYLDLSALRNSVTGSLSLGLVVYIVLQSGVLLVGPSPSLQLLWSVVACCGFATGGWALRRHYPPLRFMLSAQSKRARVSGSQG